MRNSIKSSSMVEQSNVKSIIRTPLPELNSDNRNYQNSLLLVTRINCDEIIPINHMDNHSGKCQEVTMTVRALCNSPDPLDEIHYNIKKLIVSIQRQMPIHQNEKNKVKFLLRLYEIGQCMLNQDDKYLSDLINELEIMQNLSVASRQFLMITQKLLQLSSVKIYIMGIKQNKKTQISDSQNMNLSQSRFSTKQNSRHRTESDVQGQYFSKLIQTRESNQNLSKDAIKQMIYEKKLEYESIRDMANYYQTRTLENQSRINRIMKISSVSPSLLRNSPNQRDALSIVSSASYQYEQSAHMSPLTSDALRDQRYFYSVCLKEKLALNPLAPGQQIPASLLYEECIINNVTKSGWEEFVSFELQHPKQQ